MTAQELIDQFNDNARRFVSGEVFSKGSVVGILKKACKMNDGDYRLVLKALTGKTSSKELDEAQFYALFKFVQPVKPEGQRWQSGQGDEELERLCNMLVRSTFDQPGQINFLENVS